MLWFVSCSAEKGLDAEANKTDITASSGENKLVQNENVVSEITCPECGHKKKETMPEDVCVIRYTCEKCKAELHPADGDCCVFCTYGTHKCPSMQ